MTLTFAGSAPARLSAAALRAACRCSACRHAALTGAGRDVPSDVGVARIAPMGGHAVNIVFSDGHDRGVFPWDFLFRLAAPAGATPAEVAA